MHSRWGKRRCHKGRLYVHDLTSIVLLCTRQVKRWGVKTGGEGGIYNPCGVVAYKRTLLIIRTLAGRGMITTAKQENSKIVLGKRQQRTEEWRQNTHANALLSLSFMLWKWEGDNRIVIPLALSVQEPSQPLHLRGEIHDDDLHLDFKVQLEDLRACLEGLYPCGDEHVPFETELLQRIDHLAEFSTPSQNAKLQEIQIQIGATGKV